MLEYRLLHNKPLLTKRSYCPHCKQHIAWYDLVPVFSWFFLRGRCRSCKLPISALYPIIELLTVIAFSLIWHEFPTPYFWGHALYFSALIISIRSDLELMLLSQYVTVKLIPVAFLLSIFQYLPISLAESITGALVGYGSLFIVKEIFYRYKQKEGLGDGDLELLAMIGSFTGPLGAWVALCLGSCLGALIGITILSFHPRYQSLTLPFGPFLAGASMIYVGYQPYIYKLIFTHYFF